MIYSVRRFLDKIFNWRSREGLKKFACGEAGAMLLSGNCLYAVVQGKLCTFDVSTPDEPKLLSQTNAAGSRQMVKAGECLYLSCRALGVQVFSLENPTAPREINRFYPAELATGLAVSGNVLAVTLRIYGVEFFDISDPLAVRSLSLLRTSEAQSAAFFGRDKIAIGDWAACEVLIGDVSDLSNPRIISKSSLGGYGDGVTVCGKYLYASTGIDAPGADSYGKGEGRGLEIFDISDPEKPILTGKVKFRNDNKRYPDWWSVHVSGNTAFAADCANGVYVADISDKSNPVILENLQIPDDAVSQIAVGNKVVYVSGDKTGLYCFKNNRAQIITPEKSEVPQAVVRESIPPEVNGLSNLPLEGFVWSLARLESTLYAACGPAGVKEFRLSEDGTPILQRQFSGLAMDCAVSEKLLIVAAESELKIYDRETGVLLSSADVVENMPFLQLRLFGTTLCVAGRGVYFKMWDIRDPENPRPITPSFRGGGMLYHDMLPERSVNGLFPVNWHSVFPRWYDAENFTETSALSEEFRRCSHQNNGITEIGGKFYLITRKGVLCLDPAEPENPKPIPMYPLVSGIPTSDGNTAVVSDRRNGEISFFNFDGKCFKELPERHYDLSFTVTGRALFYRGKAYIPAWSNGIYFEK